MKAISVEVVATKILFFRGKKVMLDRDLAQLYGVSTKRLNEQVRRNTRRFPEDFMFQLTVAEYNSLRSQNATLKNLASRGESEFSKRGKHSKFLPLVFTEQGIAMLSGVLNSGRAIKVNIAIMRAFVALRELLLTHKELAEKIATLEKAVGEHDEKIALIFEAIKKLLEPTLAPESEIKKPPIGFRVQGANLAP